MTTTKGGYTATQQPDGTLVVHRVPIFVECERGDMQFGREWIEAAVAKAKQAESEGYLPPLHIRHHEAGAQVRASGFFRILGTEVITFKGAQRLAVVADLHITDPATQAEVMSKRLPYRSVEIMDVSKPALDSLALLDHEAPFLELPMLAVANVAGGVPGGNTRPSHSLSYMPAGATCDALFTRGTSAQLLFKQEGETMADEPKKDEKPEKGDKQAAEGGSMDVGAIVKAIKSGAISVADMDAVLAAIAEQSSKSKATEGDDKPAPAAAPGGESMQKQHGDLSVQFAALAGENAALKSRLDSMQSDAERKEAINGALKRLEGRPMGADLEQRLVAFHREHGAKAFAAFVESIATTFAAMPSSDPKAARFAAQPVTTALSEAVRAYEKEGADAVEKAVQFSREWAEQRRFGLKVSEANYIKTNMQRVAARSN